MLVQQSHVFLGQADADFHTIDATQVVLNAFLVQNGSFLVSEDGKTVTANDPKNVDALTYVQGLWKDGTLKTPKDLGAGWAGEAFGKGSAAMTIGLAARGAGQ
jgi:multiple sugar transport system substrate-binding protein